MNTVKLETMKMIHTGAQIAGLLLLPFFSCLAQDEDKSLLKQVEQDDRTAVDAIAMYPKEIRTDIFEASKYPEVLVRMNAMQKNTKEQFTEMLAPYSREEQEKIWNLTRYPALIHDLVSGDTKSEKEQDAIIQTYPEEIRETAKEEITKNFWLLGSIDKRNAICQQNFGNILNGYPKETSLAYRDLIGYPEVLNTLFDNMQLTVVIGDVYKHDPQYVLRKTDSLNEVLSRSKAQETADWKQSLNDNPDAQKEYEQAAQEYAQQNGYSADEYTAPLNPDIYSYPSYSYNWWFGYPYWYPYAYWDPYPFWSDWGFYYGPHHRLIVFGMPSVYFMDWYFYYPEHFSRYPVFANHCYSYYGRHEGSRGWNPVSRGVHDWKSRNSDVVNAEWDKNPAGRVQRFKEYGKMESERTAYNKTHPSQPLQRSAFLQQNQSRYPNLKASAVKTGNGTGPQNRNATPREAPEMKPHVQIPESYKSDKVNPSGGTNGRPNEGPPVKNTPPQYNGTRGGNPAIHSNELHNAQQYHQNVWQQMRPAAPQHYSQPASPHFSAPPGGKRR